MSTKGSWIDADRPLDRGYLGGVCAGLAQRYGIDPILLRAAFALLALAYGVGAGIYAALWLTMPPAGGSRADEAARWRSLVSSRGAKKVWQQRDQRHTLAIALIAGGSLVLLWSTDVLGWVTPARALGLAIAAVGAGMLWSFSSGQRR